MAGTDTLAVKTQDTGTIGSSELRAEISSRFKYCSKYYQTWIDVAKKDYEFALGDQWSSEERTVLASEGRPCLTFNRIRPLINVISGYQREHSSRIKANPEGGEDKSFSEFIDKIIHTVDKWSHLNHKTGYWFDDGLYCGKSFLEAVISYDSDPIRGEVGFILNPPYQVLTDPDHKEYDLNYGCKYLFKVQKFTKDSLKSLFPKKKSLIDGLKTDTDNMSENVSASDLDGIINDYGNIPGRGSIEGHKADDPEMEADNDFDQKFTLKEYWREKKVKKYFVIEAESGEPRRFDTNDEAEAFARKQGGGIKVIERDITEMWVADSVCGIILQDIKSPFEPYYSGYPFFRFLADWAPNAASEEYRVQGVTRQLIDPQKEKNKAKSQNLHILNTQANSGWIGDEDALTPENWNRLEDLGSKPGVIIKKKAGKELREITPKGPNQGNIQREQSADNEFREISGINPDLLGMQQSGESGRAILLRLHQGIVALSRIFANFRYSKEILGNFIMNMIPLLFDYKKAIHVVGLDYMSRSKDEKHPNGLVEGDIEAFLMMIKDNKYDVFVAEADENATLRTETLMQLTDLMKSGAPIPPDLLIDYMDVPNAEEVKSRMMEYIAQKQAAQIPPGSTAPNAGQPPELPNISGQ
jgi:hypothetical protein